MGAPGSLTCYLLAFSRNRVIEQRKVSRRILVFLLAALILMMLTMASALALPPQAANGCNGIKEPSPENNTPAAIHNPLIKLCKDQKKT
jgi:hypothetical protein